MKVSRWALRWTAGAAATLTVAATLPSALAATQAPASGPTLRLIAAQNTVTASRYGKFAYLDPGVYLTAGGSKLEFDVQRASYATPLTITQVIHLPGGGIVRRPLPGYVLDGWNGLRHFARLTVTNSLGKTVAGFVTPFCPDAYNPQRSSPDSPASSPYPQGCSTNPFTKGMVWGLQRGWGAEVIGNGFGGVGFRLQLGKYTMTINITKMWRRILHVSAKAGTVVVPLTVVKGGSGCQFGPCASHRKPGHAGTLPALPAVPTIAHPSTADLPDLTPLPSWGIGVQNVRATKKNPAFSFLDFGATVEIGGNARLDVEGFRHNGRRLMQAYQYFWHNGRVVGRARTGTMGFDNQKGHQHWHFEQFAQYRLLTANKSLAVRSQKVGFCIAPTDPIDLLLPNATWVPTYTGLGGACGSPSALWVQEALPVGWGDTYVQYSAGQAFDISHLPNGTYYIEIIANPEKILYETNYSNDSSLRKVIIGGTPGHRTVRVPAYDGIDPEG
jgi:hypothetical protein